jgi:hypothetical protein
VLVVVVVLAGANHIPFTADEFPLTSPKKTKFRRRDNFEEVVAQRRGREEK